MAHPAYSRGTFRIISNSSPGHRAGGGHGIGGQLRGLERRAAAAGSAGQTLIARWNGTAWKQIASPSPGSSASVLRGVTATSAGNAWAVGDFSNGGPSQVFAIHCC